MTLRRILGNLAKSLDSSAIGSYLSKGASETDFRAILYSEISGTPSVVGDSAVATAIVDSAYVQARQGSTTSLTNIDSAASLAILDSDYMQSRITAGGVGFKVYHFETTNGQTTFQDSDADGDVLGYTENGILVFKNGVLLLDSSDYTASDGTSVVLTSGTDSGELVSIAKWSLGGGGAASISWGGDRGVWAGGYNAGYLNVMDYVDLSTPGNATDFGDLTSGRNGNSGTADGTYAVQAIGYTGSSYSNIMDYITVATPGNATDFGDYTSSVREGLNKGVIGDGTYGLFGGGIDGAGSAFVNIINYITIASPGNSTDFGDLTTARYTCHGGTDATYGLWAGGSSSNVIDYVTIATTGNATDFGDQTAYHYDGSGVSDSTRFVMMGGYEATSNRNIIDYVTTATPGNATDFGDMTGATYVTAGASNGTNGVIGGGAMAGSTNTNTLEYIVIQTTGNATDFGDLAQARNSGHGAASGSPS